ncbi:hypothetical protein LZ30DRAFT_787353 [Colletotrichum cereale]|nr:hypothetical protein LZ30DRAFT_787353 [Colletotrichum cereale]
MDRIAKLDATSLVWMKRKHLCVNAVLKDITTTITGSACGNNRAKGSKLLLETKGQTTSASALDSSATTATASTVDDIPAETATTAPSPAPSGTPAGAIVCGVIGGLAVIGLTALGIIWVLRRSRREKSGASAAAPSVTDQPYTYSAMPHSGGSLGTPITSVAIHSFHHSAPAVPIFTPMPSEGPYQPIAAPLSSVPEDGRRLSEVPAINPPGTGNNATELPSERYDRD